VTGGERRTATERVPTRVPGEGGMELEPMAGNLQLRRPEIPLLAPQPSKPAPPPAPEHPTDRERFKPGAPVRVSGVYDVVDERGRYLEHQITCHKGTRFPPASHEAILRWVAAEAKVPDPGGYEYALAYEAVHLAPDELPPPHPPTVHLPGEKVSISGVYNLVDREGNYLLHQRALVEEVDEFEVPDDRSAYGYVLAYPAKHLTRG